MLASAGATVVGMNTVPEVVAARDEGIGVLVLSLVTNMVVGVEQAARGRRVREELDTEVRNRNICPRTRPSESILGGSRRLSHMEA